ncbi:CoA-transferase subunit beta [Bacillus chungangensis]|uniref:Glutaconate CoA-transferase subunit B n=1 Tax=Bacillus chungangensis TaxID=587633 RepID=A0ABT9WYV4_9BACI|nr:CoA-transferase [Bacillus chungangensis]MDQ0178476.1 glutaconate CoA-transferase subunit B [Bacillus chungangensis]
MKATQYRIGDMMTCAIANMLQDGETVFHGVSSHLPMVAMALAQNMHAPHLVHLNIPGGMNPSSIKKAAYSSAGSDLLASAEAYFPLEQVFDLSMRGKLDVAFLGGVQFDLYGNVNASVIGDYHQPKVRLPGGAGSAVLIPTAKKAIIWRTKHDKRTFVEKVDFVTTRGNLWKIVTPLCIFENRGGKLHLDSIHPTSSLEEVKENTGFELLYDEVKYTQPPTETELSILKKIDPFDYRSLEF